MPPKRDASDTEYESAVADVLGFLAGDGAVVERNVKLPGRRSKVDRQIDVVVRQKSFGAETILLVDCKRWDKPLDVADVGAFLGLVEDVGADQGLLVSTKGASPAGMELAREARGVRLDVMTLEELERWRPPGTVDTVYRIPADKQAEATKKLRRAGFRVSPHPAETPEGEVTIEVSRHYGTRHPSAEVQSQQWEVAKAAMAKAGVTDPVHVSHGISIGGGTPAHMALEVTFDGQRIGLKFFAATEEEAGHQLEPIREHLAERGGISPERVSYDRPPGWPVEGLFGGWPQ